MGFFLRATRITWGIFHSPTFSLERELFSIPSVRVFLLDFRPIWQHCLFEISRKVKRKKVNVQSVQFQNSVLENTLLGTTWLIPKFLVSYFYRSIIQCINFSSNAPESTFQCQAEEGSTASQKAEEAGRKWRLPTGPSL